MAEKIDPELFQHLVELAALELDEKEAEYLRRELNNQLKAIDELAAIPIPEGTPAASHGVPYAAGMRPPSRADRSIDSQLADDILKQAPESEAGYISVPEIPHEELG
ncbi:MAG: aspartyl/glutamyl-tRNA amidotransferase subunit C [Anaerolineales bacterium]